MTTTDTDRARLAAGLEDAARLLREHDDLPLPYTVASPGTDTVEVVWALQLRWRGLAPDEQARQFLRISARFSSTGDWTRYLAVPAGSMGWECVSYDHLRLIVTYRLAEATS